MNLYIYCYSLTPLAGSDSEDVVKLVKWQLAVKLG